MDPGFIPIQVTPSKTPFGLDQLVREYKTALSAEDAIAAAPAAGAADEVFPFMFLMPISTPESAESATRVDLVYMGSLGVFASAGGLSVGTMYSIFDYHAGDDFSNVGGGNSTGITFIAIGTTPADWSHGSILVHAALPAQKTDQSTAVQSATSSKLNTGQTLASPATLQYYAPATVLTYFSSGAPGTTTAPAPDASPVPITLTVSDTTYSSGGGVQGSIDALFILQIISTIESTEIVPGQYWQNVARTSKLYSPWIFDVASGPYLSLYSPGNGYTIGDTLTISSGGESATVVLDSVGSVWGGGTGILSYHVTANSFTVAHNAVPASGGTGSGAGFNVFIIP